MEEIQQLENTIGGYNRLLADTEFARWQFNTRRNQLKEWNYWLISFGLYPHLKLPLLLYKGVRFLRKMLRLPLNTHLSSIIMGVLPGGGGDKAVGVITGNGVDRVDTGDSA
ncbi:hypothetical protein TNCV_1442161 [Trichonephila clavipes]|uniref:Uncharacterized protein n=1 Tax=Trichonephila clavipes TaxID=2585209 RepID=A0A8X6V6A8_TRICX|nr:hypothetical protein TNCV_1442161 [Trichonephila clavipes]